MPHLLTDLTLIFSPGSANGDGFGKEGKLFFFSLSFFLC